MDVLELEFAALAILKTSWKNIVRERQEESYVSGPE